MTMAGRSGGWQWTWVVTGAAALTGLLLAGRIAVLLCRPAAGALAAVQDNAPPRRGGG